MYEDTVLRPAGSTLAGSTETEIPAANAEIQRLGKLVAEARSNLTAFIDRMLIGDAPRSDQAEAPRARRSFNAGLTGNLRREIELAAEIAEDVNRLSNRLSQIG